MASPQQRSCGCFPLDDGPLSEATSGIEEPHQDISQRLRTAFWDTFMKLPEPARTAINVHWNAVRSSTGGRTPSVELSTYPAGAARKNVLAATNSAAFWFHPHVLSHAPDKVVEALVAHELAHALLQAKRKTFESDKAEEQVVPFITFGWGYEDQDIDEWRAEVNASTDLSAA